MHTFIFIFQAIEEQSFAPLCASLCSAMKTVQVNSKDGETASFKKLIINKCQSLFELDKAQEIYSAKKLTEINSCKDPVISITNNIVNVIIVNLL